jgi:hypothetical protein
LNLRLRGIGLAVMLPAVALLATARSLQPSPDLNGTHGQLGIPPCSFLMDTRYPCPTCGMTTAMAAMAHGRVLLAAQAQPAGVALFLAAVAAALAGATQIVAGKDILRHARPTGRRAILAGVMLLAGWGLKIVIGLAMGTLPV